MILDNEVNISRSYLYLSVSIRSKRKSIDNKDIDMKLSTMISP